jgi:hypothetical protein
MTTVDSGVGLSASQMDGLLHHFTEENISPQSVTCSSWDGVNDAHAKLRAVKDRVLTELMNSSDYRNALCVEKTFNPAGVPGPVKGVGSLMVASLTDSSNVPIGSMAANDPITHQNPSYLKIPVSVNGVSHAVSVVPDMLMALLQRDNVWQGADKLKRAVYDVVYSSESVPDLSQWKLADGGRSISVNTASGLRLECAFLHNNRSSNTKIRESDHTFSRRMMCQGVTRTYSTQPIVVTARFSPAVSHMLQVCVYPCSVRQTGLLMATTHVSGFERPLRSCAVVVPCAIRRHVTFGVHEADVSALVTPITRAHVRTLAQMFSKCAVMRAVLGTSAPVFTVNRLGDMDELELHTQYTSLRGMCTHTQLQTCAGIWDEVNMNHTMGLVCVAGTLDTFENDQMHTDVAMHTHSIMDTTFKHEGKDFSVSSPIVVSLYGTYYHQI